MSQAIEHFTEPRGEFTLVIEGNKEKERTSVSGDIEQKLDELRLGGAKAKEAIALLASEGGPTRRDLYQAWLRLKKKD